MGLLDEILKQLEQAQQQGEGRQRPRPSQPQPSRLPERESDEDGAEWEEDEAARPGHAPHTPSRRPPERARPAVPEPSPRRITASSVAELAPHQRAVVVSAARLRALLASPNGIRDLMVANEILGKPLALRRRHR